MLPKRGEIWLINLDPTVGAEIQKTLPAIVLAIDRKRTSLTAVKMTNRSKFW